MITIFSGYLKANSINFAKIVPAKITSEGNLHIMVKKN